MKQGKYHKKISAVLDILVDLGMPRAQQNERSALCLLALLKLTPNKKWSQSENPAMGVTPIMDWVSKHYKKRLRSEHERKPSEDKTIHQFVEAGIAIQNPGQAQTRRE